MSTKEDRSKYSNPVPDVTEEEEKKIREEYEHFVYSTTRRMHIPEDDEGDSNFPLGDCIRTSSREEVEENWDKKPVSVFPQGFKPICSICGQVWRQNKD